MKGKMPTEIGMSGCHPGALARRLVLPDALGAHAGMVVLSTGTRHHRLNRRPPSSPPTGSFAPQLAYFVVVADGDIVFTIGHRCHRRRDETIILPVQTLLLCPPRTMPPHSSMLYPISVAPLQSNPLCREHPSAPLPCHAMLGAHLPPVTEINPLAQGSSNALT
uniref:Uncharacterized protein n=1 Tax=Oryza punctata TaxID=4537 RepID=A0A0E0LB78_ORYPU